MPKFTKTIYLLGTHANFYSNIFLNTNEDIEVVSISFKYANPFDSERNQIQINDTYHDFEGDYDLVGLSEFFKNILSYDLSTTDSSLCIGDPSELLYQAFLLVKNEHSLHRETMNNTVNLFIYPVGMVAMDIRKELSSLMYTLKKFGNPTFLIRKEEKDLKKLFSIIANTIGILSFMELADEIKGLEQLIHPKMSYF